MRDRKNRPSTSETEDTSRQSIITIGHKCRKQYTTLLLSLIFFGQGINPSLMGTTLLDLKDLTNTTTVGGVSSIFVGRGCGSIIGALAGGILLERFNKVFLLFLILLVRAGIMFIIPWCTKFYALLIVITMLGIVKGVIDTGMTVMCFNLWGRKSASYMQVLHFSIGLGAFVAPFIVDSFVSSTNMTAKYQTDVILKTFPPPAIAVSTPSTRSTFTNSASPHNARSVQDHAGRGEIFGSVLSEKKSVSDMNSVHAVALEAYHGKRRASNDVIDTNDLNISRRKMAKRFQRPYQNHPRGISEAPPATITRTRVASITKADIGDEGYREDNLALASEITSGNVEYSPQVTIVTVVYAIAALFEGISGFLFCTVHWCTPNKKSIHNNDIERQDGPEISKRYKYLILAHFFIFIFISNGAANGYGALVTTYAVRYLRWTKSGGDLVTAVYWGSYAFGRLLSAGVAMIISPPKMLLIDLILTMTSLIMMLFLIESYDNVFWVGTALCGISMAPVVPSSFSWLANHFCVTGKVASMLMVACSLGNGIFPALLGFLIDRATPMFFLYTLIGSFYICCGFYIFVLSLVSNDCRRNHSFQERLLNEFSSDDDDTD